MIHGHSTYFSQMPMILMTYYMPKIPVPALRRRLRRADAACLRLLAPCLRFKLRQAAEVALV